MILSKPPPPPKMDEPSPPSRTPGAEPSFGFLADYEIEDDDGGGNNGDGGNNGSGRRNPAKGSGARHHLASLAEFTFEDDDGEGEGEGDGGRNGGGNGGSNGGGGISSDGISSDGISSNNNNGGRGRNHPRRRRAKKSAGFLADFKFEDDDEDGEGEGEGEGDGGDGISCNKGSCRRNFPRRSGAKKSVGFLADFKIQDTEDDGSGGNDDDDELSSYNFDSDSEEEATLPTWDARHPRSRGRLALSLPASRSHDRDPSPPGRQARDDVARSFGRSTIRRSAMPHEILHDSSFMESLERLAAETRAKDWVRSFKRLDPRFQILEFFNDLSLGGVDRFEKSGCRAKGSWRKPKLLRAFVKNGIFSVWRPTSQDAIRKMITGEGTGKGLDIKGKSAQRGIYSGFVPFLQIHDNAHKKRVGTMRKDKRVRVFYPNRYARDTAANELRALATCMRLEGQAAKERLTSELRRRRAMVQRAAEASPSAWRPLSLPAIDSSLDLSRKNIMEDPAVRDIDDYVDGAGVYGLDIPEKVFWEGYVIANDITRDKRQETGRPSMPEFQQMNLDTLRKGERMAEQNGGPRPVLWHGGCAQPGKGDPMCPIDLLMAYEENSKVTPVVSDFDCFLLGTRGVKYHEPLGKKELSMLSWCVDEIKGILDTPKDGSNWTSRWLEVKKKHVDHPAHAKMPPFGYADSRSYSIMKGAVHKLRSNGAVRHGPECFNYGFPQDLDEKYLVISDVFPGVPWRYTNAEGLTDILCDQIEQGFTFPLNPKWVLCDPGWKRVYDKLMASQKPNVQDSLRIWYPDSIRDRIDEISAKHPQGFVETSKGSDQSSGVRADLAQLELSRYRVRQSSIRKLQVGVTKACSVAKLNAMTESDTSSRAFKLQNAGKAEANPGARSSKDRMRDKGDLHKGQGERDLQLNFDKSLQLNESEISPGSDAPVKPSRPWISLCSQEHDEDESDMNAACNDQAPSVIKSKEPNELTPLGKPRTESKDFVRTDVVKDEEMRENLALGRWALLRRMVHNEPNTNERAKPQRHTTVY